MPISELTLKNPIHSLSWLLSILICLLHTQVLIYTIFIRIYNGSILAVTLSSIKVTINPFFPLCTNVCYIIAFLYWATLIKIMAWSSSFSPLEILKSFHSYRLSWVDFCYCDNETVFSEHFSVNFHLQLWWLDTSSHFYHNSYLLYYFFCIILCLILYYFRVSGMNIYSNLIGTHCITQSRFSFYKGLMSNTDKSQFLGPSSFLIMELC